MTLQDDYRAHVKAEKRRLKALPYFSESEEKRRAFVVLFEVLEKHSFEDVLRWVPSGCSDPLYRVLALEYLSRTRQPGSETWDDTTLAEDTTVVGDLVVRGHLTNGAALTVLGDLTIEGAYIADGDYPCCQVAGRLSSKNYFAVEAETIALGGLHVADTFWVSYNHTITIAPVLEAARACVQDSFVSAELRAARSYVNEPVPTSELFGFEADDPEPHVRDWMRNQG